MNIYIVHSLLDEIEDWKQSYKDWHQREKEWLGFSDKENAAKCRRTKMQRLTWIKKLHAQLRKQLAHGLM